MSCKTEMPADLKEVLLCSVVVEKIGGWAANAIAVLRFASCSPDHVLLGSL